MNWMLSTNYILKNLKQEQLKETLRKIDWDKQQNIIHVNENFRIHLQIEGYLNFALTLVNRR